MSMHQSLQNKQAVTPAQRTTNSAAPSTAPESSDTASIYSTTPLLDSETTITATGGKSATSTGARAKAKTLWKTLKEEDLARRSEVKHVTHQEATAITGHGEDAKKHNVKNGPGDKTSPAALFLFAF
ncbi:hypothetical protein E8E13_001036 [Curvularia kusanoi]|uniref:Uncharacterized protein n=1 Tax=Curvularia kusanoi TaxID=90978 RepID=A0A9P4WBA3_CURKU|nr:hypothetical protein E8E13_001036 [Curvularia kusanoi]